MPPDVDYLLVGGGLQNGLIALALLNRNPDVRILLVEKESRLAGDHTWSFHQTDVPSAARPWFDPLISARWDKVVVRFPHHFRTYASGYASILSSSFDEVVSKTIDRSSQSQLKRSCEVKEVFPHGVRLASGETISASLVVDSRGPIAQHRGTGYQKFIGWDIELAEGLLPTSPTIMDATVAQRDGYRFLYILPFTRTRGLIEDTVFSDSAHLSRTDMRQSILNVLHDHGYQVRRLLREESGVLPMPWVLPRLTDPVYQPGLLRAGYRGGWFHPATGYSLPIACRLAQAIADAHDREPIDQVMARLMKEHASQSRFARLLNRLLFSGFAPEDRYHVFERFYRMPLDLIERFYRLELTKGDQKSLVCGRPPRGFSFRTFLRNHFVRNILPSSPKPASFLPSQDSA
jgi:lycopene beta-cyclase